MKALIRLRECAGWSGPSLSAYARRYIFTWCHPNNVSNNKNLQPTGFGMAFCLRLDGFLAITSPSLSDSMRGDSDSSPSVSWIGSSLKVLTRLGSGEITSSVTSSVIDSRKVQKLVQGYGIYKFTDSKCSKSTCPTEIYLPENWHFSYFSKKT